MIEQLVNVEAGDDGTRMYLDGEEIAFHGPVVLKGTLDRILLIDNIDRCAWLDENGSGYYWILYPAGGNMAHFFFTDAATAFHFKVRWQ